LALLEGRERFKLGFRVLSGWPEIGIIIGLINFSKGLDHLLILGLVYLFFLKKKGEIFSFGQKRKVIFKGGLLTKVIREILTP